jgi:branched-chain amino acid aminotransferase
MVFVAPVGPYFKTGFTPTDMVITRDHDRAAPLGTGKYKCGGNYGASLASGYKAKKHGYSAVVYLDAKEKKYIDECGPANFFGIKNNTYITPESTSILPSITNASLQTLAMEMGMKVEKRKIPVEELETFEEVGACGTAAVISPVRSIVDEQVGKTYFYGDEPGPVSSALYKKLKEIQYGDLHDDHNWVSIVK